MEAARELGRAMLVIGGVLVLCGLLLIGAGRLPLRIGRLPGDIVYQGRHSTLYVPIITCILLSAVLTLLFWLFGHLRR